MPFDACIAPGCKNLRNKKLKRSFFSFPKEPGRCHKWLQFCGLEHKYKTSTAAHCNLLRLCSDHFNQTDYYSVHMGQKKMLHSTAVPSIHSNGILVPREVPQPAISSPTLAVLLVPQNMSQPANCSPTLAPTLSTPGHIVRFQKHKLIRTYARRAKMQKTGTAQDTQTGDTSGPASHVQLWSAMMSSTPKYSLFPTDCDIKHEEDPLKTTKIKTELQDFESEIKTEAEGYGRFPISEVVDQIDIKPEPDSVASINTLTETNELLDRQRNFSTPKKEKRT